MSTRLADDTEQSNKVATMSASLATDIDDPIERMPRHPPQHAVGQGAHRSGAGPTRSQSVGEVAPPLLINLASRAAWAANVAGRVIPPVQNVVVSNIPGPPIPLYSCGAKMTGIYAASMLLLMGGLNITMMSYVDRIDFGLTSDPDLVDDPWEIADGLPEALTELMDAAGLGKPREVRDPFEG